MPSSEPLRRGFFRRFAAFAGVSAAGAAAAVTNTAKAAPLPAYARAQEHRSLKQSSFDHTGGNKDYWQVPAGETKEVFRSAGPGVITHIWFTIASQSPTVWKELVLRIYWDGNTRPSVEAPLGDFFGLNLGEFYTYQSLFLNSAPNRAVNAWFAMPFQHSARITVSNEGAQDLRALYSNIDYKTVSALPADAMYFHAQYRQSAPAQAVVYPGGEGKNSDGEKNYVFVETRGRGHLMGVTLGVLQNKDKWFGEGDEMIFIDGESHPAITGTGTEDYFLGAYDFGGRDHATPFGYLYNGAPFITTAERTGGKYCMYRWHADNPVTFRKYLKHTIEHGHANDRGDAFYSVCYWYQSEPYTAFPDLPKVTDRIPKLPAQS
ncbi:MAG: hypothetical protein JWO80_3492 [Bryobacterales bacterium]|nr:hypothetical protein [Bryobacterales bacterium]